MKLRLTPVSTKELSRDVKPAPRNVLNRCWQVGQFRSGDKTWPLVCTASFADRFWGTEHAMSPSTKTARVKITLVFVEETGTFVILVVFGLLIRIPAIVLS